MKLVPETKTFIVFVVGMDQDPAALKDEIGKLTLLLQPLLEGIHAMMVSNAFVLTVLENMHRLLLNPDHALVIY
jgi:hypothetical protein